MGFISLILSLTLLVGASRSEEIEHLNQELQQLEEMKRGYEGRALRYENQVEYLQFEQQTTLETRRLIQLAQEQRNKAALAQEQIDRLKAKRAQLEK